MRKTLVATGLAIVGATGVFSTANAIEWDLDVYGVSYHLNPSEANKHAPRDLRIGERGQTVFNPGIGIGIDFRNNPSSNGFSFQTKVGWLQDCDAKDLYYGGAGVRWRHIFGKRIAFDVNALAIAGYGQDWDTKEYNWTLLPYVDVGIGYVFNVAGRDRVAMLKLAYLPSNSNISATSGTDLLFISLTFGF